jgi:hemerythrin
MPILEWSERYSINVEEIDNHHRDMVHMINYLHDAMKKGEGKEAIYHLLRALAAYAAIHFETEEKYMLRYGYPEYPEHRAEHNWFVKKIKEFQDGYNDGRIPLSMDVMKFLKDWFSDHTNGTDKKIGQFFNEKGMM